jgi:hypothetical protein
MLYTRQNCRNKIKKVSELMQPGKFYIPNIHNLQIIMLWVRVKFSKYLKSNNLIGAKFVLDRISDYS